MGKIHVLSEHLTNMIAAGEVVERPAGIVKECVENSIDAGAKVIEVEAYQGGIDRLVIQDDGSGMDPDDAHMAFQRHATSKMIDEEDLFNIQTMGFRGEALPSIASVAKVDLQTNDGTTSTQIRYSYGKLELEEQCSCPLGTRIEISGLFLKTPARFKHLKSTNYEFSIIADMVNKMALSHPDIRFKLSHDGKVVFQTTGNGNIQEILYQMYGREVAQAAVPFDGRSEDFHIHGYAVQPKISRATKYFMFITMNTRLIRSVPIQKAIVDAYSDFMPPNRFPIVVLQIDTDTQLVDVNVHPNKWEIRLSKQAQLLELIEKTIRETFIESLKTVEIKPRPQKTFEQPTLNFSYPTPQPRPVTEKKPVSFGFEEYKPVTQPEIKIEEEPLYVPKPEEFVPEPVQEDEIGKEFFQHLQILGQHHDSYIICTNQHGLVIIDQHAAQERYHYEQLVDTLNNPVTQKQPLMVPVQLHVSADILAQLDKINESTAFFGLEFEQFGNDRILVREIPLWLQNVDQEPFLNDLLDYFVQNNTVDMKSLRKHVLATTACHSSIRFNRPLSMEEMKKVIVDLQNCRQPYHCPHGRPTVITFSDKDLFKEFERG
ncbi:MAG: DNA mismatch repair endonuclease MutL [Faecalicoccus sp.]|nr:DNA mismatch repair endonuclease MutL [Faecalicoccus sp.]